MAAYGETFHGYIRGLDKGEATWHLWLFLGKGEKQRTCVLTDGAQVVLHKCIRKADQDWSKYLPSQATKVSNAYSSETFEAETLPQKREQTHCQQHGHKFLEEGDSPMKKRRPSNGSSNKTKINLVKVAREDLYHIDI